MFFSQKNNYKIRQVPVINIIPNKSQPRTEFLKDELESLRDSIKENGILQPLTIRKTDINTKYELIAGERRLRASIMAGLEYVPCIIINCDESQSAVFALLENLQRCDLNPFEEAEGIKNLINSLNITQEEAAIRLGKKQSTIANKLRLLKLTPKERRILMDAGLSERHARALLKLTNEQDRAIVLDKIIRKNLNVHQAEEEVKNVLMCDQIKIKPIKRRIIIKDVRIFINTINKAINTMKISGIDAISEETETEEFIEYTVKIPKNIAIKKKPA